MYYVAREGKTKCIKFLIENGCSIDHVDIYRQSPLYYAVRENHIDTAQLLIDYFGPDESERKRKINQRDTENETALFYAVNEGHLEMTKMLIENGADFNIENNSHRTVYDIVKDKASKLRNFFNID